MIKCDKCGAMNRLGVIFCQECGQRMNLDDAPMQIADAKRRERYSPKRVFTLVRKLVSLLLMILIVLILIGVFLGVPMQHDEHLSKDTITAVRAKVNRMLDPGTRTGNDPRVTVTSAEATALINHLSGLGPTAEGEAIENPGLALAPRLVSVEFLPSGYVRLVLESETFKGITVYNTLIGRFEAGDGPVEFVVQSAKFGKVPMIGPLVGVVSNRFATTLQNREAVEKLREVVDFIEVEDGKAILHLKQVER